MGENINDINIIDVIIVMDSTGSMQSWINSAKNTVISAFSDIRKQYPNSTIRLGLVCYRDIGDEERFILASLTENIESIHEVLKGVRATGGNDTAEDVAGALDKVLDLFNEGLPREPGQTEKYNPIRIVLFVTDAPAHGLRYHSITEASDRFPKGDPDGKEPYDQIVQLVNMNVDLTIFRINSSVDKMIEEFQKAFVGSQSTLTILDVSNQNDHVDHVDHIDHIDHIDHRSEHRERKEEYIDYGSPLSLSSSSLINGFIDLSTYDEDCKYMYSSSSSSSSSKSSSEPLSEPLSEKTFRNATFSSIASSIQRRKDINKI
jgi:von Willebrand factor type A domain